MVVQIWLCRAWKLSVWKEALWPTVRALLRASDSQQMTQQFSDRPSQSPVLSFCKSSLYRDFCLLFFHPPVHSPAKIHPSPFRSLFFICHVGTYSLFSYIIYPSHGDLHVYLWKDWLSDILCILTSTDICVSDCGVFVLAKEKEKMLCTHSCAACWGCRGHKPN